MWFRFFERHLTMRYSDGLRGKSAVVGVCASTPRGQNGGRRGGGGDSARFHSRKMALWRTEYTIHTVGMVVVQGMRYTGGHMLQGQKVMNKERGN